tara:strand:+ start:1500 stop:1874 length:375 start_codon:yes stop_codon:yes gene_type:complete
MIDTDKYEGHTEGPWVWDDLHSSGKEMLFVHRKGDDNDIIANVNGVINGKLECANAQLIADAPLLLAEVKRLQRDITMLENNLEHTKHIFRRSLERCTETKESLLAEIKRLSLTVEDTRVMRNE